MNNFSKKSLNVSPSLTLAITAKANELKARGLDVISFGVGEPDFSTSNHILQAAKYALDHGMTKYTAVSGTPALRQAICDKLQKDNNLTYTPNQIVVSSGAKQSLFNSLQILLDEGDEVIIISPYWLTYPEMVKMCGGKCVYVEAPASREFVPYAEDIEKAITDKTKAIIINSPNNPTGAVYSKDDLTKIAQVLDKYPNVWVIADEIYEKLIYDGLTHYSIAQVDGMYQRTIVINGLSKAYAMTGWRIGYCACPTEKCAKLMSGMQSHQTSNPNSIAQYASQVALQSDDRFVQDMRAQFEQRRNRMIESVSHLPNVQYVYAKGAFYIMLDVSALFGKYYKDIQITCANVFAQVVITYANTVVIPCESFGAHNFVRLSYATNESNIIEGINRIFEIIENVK